MFNEGEQPCWLSPPPFIHIDSIKTGLTLRSVHNAYQKLLAQTRKLNSRRMTVSTSAIRLCSLSAPSLSHRTPSFAIFGVGDIVFDPTSYASLVSQATTALNQLKTIQNNVEHFSIKQQCQTALTKLENMNVASMFGETAGINIALNANSPTASMTGWKTATMPMSSGTASYLQAQNANSAQRVQLAMIETSDAISPDCLTAVGTYRSGRNQNSNANSLGCRTIGALRWRSSSISSGRQW
jgi:hypothetical protein